MIKIQVNTANPYEVAIVDNQLFWFGSYLKSIHKPCKTFIITDDNVASLYLDIVRHSLVSAGFNVSNFVFNSGEQNKTMNTYLEIIKSVAQNRLNREDIIIGLGGGVVGDIAGFVASTYMRGISFVQAPTTLLSGIDASIGGKTGVDLAEGKNLIGTFHQPKAVFFDTFTLNTLPKSEILNGLGEGVKYAVLMGGEVFDIMEKGVDETNFLRFVELCVRYKIGIVEKDEKESGIRRLLNLGHTIGHAIEKLSNYSIQHGVAVVKGISIIAQASFKNGKLDKSELDRLVSLIKNLGFDLTCPYNTKMLMSAIVVDKKMGLNNSINIIDILALGNCCTAKLTLNELKDYIYATLH